VGFEPYVKCRHFSHQPPVLITENPSRSKVFKSFRIVLLLRTSVSKEISVCLHWRKRIFKRRKNTKLKLGNNASL
jgi:hypothetical protein